MLGKLNDEQIEETLRTNLLGRIGCHANDLTYVVPVHYVYQEPYIYAHSATGLKISLMRKNPAVCFEIDEIRDFFNWQSVICWADSKRSRIYRNSSRRYKRSSIVSNPF